MTASRPCPPKPCYLYEELYGVEAAVDVVVATPGEVERYRDAHALVIKPALREGRVVYDAA